MGQGHQLSLVVVMPFLEEENKVNNISVASLGDNEVSDGVRLVRSSNFKL